MSTALAAVPSQPLATQGASWNQEQTALIKRTVAPEATNDELAMFLHVAAKAGLDPLQKQVWFVKRSGRVTIQAGVDGLQARALRMPDCEGIASAAVYEKEDFVFDKAKGEVIKHQSNPFGAQGRLVGAWGIVHRKGKSPFVALVRYDEYADSNSPLWKNKPAVMLEKVARSTALRRAYPENFGGIYDPAEMGKDALAEPSTEEPRPALAAASQAIEGEIVHPGPPKPPPAPAPSAPMPAPHALALWNRVVALKGGNKALAKPEWEQAAKAAGVPPSTAAWTLEDTKAVEEIIFPTDVPF
jgi:phage recombination protein Bet